MKIEMGESLLYFMVAPCKRMPNCTDKLESISTMGNAT